MLGVAKERASSRRDVPRRHPADFVLFVLEVAAAEKELKPSCPSPVPDTCNSHVRIVAAVPLLTVTMATVP
jgi:hypothetical protein